MHHRFDDSPDDYDMDMDQRTRMFGGRGGRIILLGDGTEILTGPGHDGDGDVDMEERGEAEEDSSEEQDLEEQVRKDALPANGETPSDRSQRGGTPAPASSSDMTRKVDEAKQRQTADEPKTMAAADNADIKGAVEQATQTK